MTSPVTRTIEAMRPYDAGKPLEELARELGVHDAIKLASNENPLGPSPRALEALSRATSSLHRYPDASAHELRARLARLHGVEPSQIVQGNGSNEILELLVRTFTTSRDHIVFAKPSFVVYELASLAHGVPFTAVPVREWRHDLDAMADAVRTETRLVFIANPNNPTGTYVGREALERFLVRVPPEVIVAVDEAYLEYADASDYPDALELRTLRERLVVVRTFSKIHGLAALRVGYAVAPAQLADYLHRVRAPFNVGTLGQVAALAALDDTEHVERSRRSNREGRSRLGAALTELGCEVVPSQANFVFVDLRRPAAPVYDALLRKGVIVRWLGPALGTFLRITIGTPAENQRLLQALVEVLA